MIKKKSKSANLGTPVTESWEIWNHLMNTGLDTIYYDNEFLNGNSSFNGLSNYLGFGIDKNNIVERLKKNTVSAEKFIGAFFKVLQPYAQMMNDICIFFSNHKVKGTNETLKIVFDFGNITENLDFNLENFRSVLTNYTKVKKKVTYYHVTSVWALHSILRNFPITNEKIANRKAKKWLDAYDSDRYLKPELELSATGYDDLDLQLQRVLDLWNDYVNTCRSYSENVSEFRTKFRSQNSDDDRGQQPSGRIDLTLGWSANQLGAEMDRWSASIIELLFGFVESLAGMPERDRDRIAESQQMALQNYFNGLPKSEAEIEDVVTELTELLNMPVWKKRYELFSTWMLSALDQALANYDRKIHDNSGVLLLNFSATHLMTVQSADGPFEIWAENRTYLLNPTGHGRKSGIQPDYTIYQPTVGDPKDCIACVEVKQYKKASVRNFGNALNDYANGLPNADIFLANYGPVPASLPLVHPTRSSCFGGVQPFTAILSTFKTALLQTLPLAKALTVKEVVQKTLTELSIDTIYVDVSGSMDRVLQREYIRSCLRNLLKHKKAATLVAMDNEHLKQWVTAGEDQVEELLSWHFYSGNDFDVQHIGGGTRNLIITDRAGAQQVWEYGFRPIIIMLENESAELWTYVENGDSYIQQATETIEVDEQPREKGFEGWLFKIQ